MTVSELITKMDLNAPALPEPDRVITGGYVGDLLSWVMGRCEKDSAWITIMSNINCIAVATLADVSAIILAEGVTPDEELIKSAKERGINLLLSELPAYETAVRLSELLK